MTINSYLTETRLSRLFKHRGVATDQTETLHREFKSKYSDVSDDHADALRSYTGVFSKKINSKLFHDTKMDKSHKHLDDRISGAVRQHRAHRNFHVFSGLRSPEDHPTDKKTGHKMLHNKAYTSTSLDSIIGSDFGSSKKHDGDNSSHRYHYDTKELYDNTNKLHRKNKDNFKPYVHVAKIHVPSSSHGVYAQPHSQYGTEKEYLLHKGAKFAFRHEPTVDHTSRHVIWHGKLVHDGVNHTRHGKDMGLDEEK